MATHFSILTWKVPWIEEPGQATIHGAAKSQTGLSDGRARAQEYLHNGNRQMTGIKRPPPTLLARESNQHTTACPNEDP